MRIKWTELSIDDLENIRDYIALDNEFYSKIFIEKIVVSVEKLVDFPQLGRVVPEIGIEEIRELIYRDYRIIYEVKDEEVNIVTVVHGSRDIGPELMDL